MNASIFQLTAIAGILNTILDLIIKLMLVVLIPILIKYLNNHNKK